MDTVVKKEQRLRYAKPKREVKTHLTTKERIAAFCDNMENVNVSEINWGKPQGKEVW